MRWLTTGMSVLLSVSSAACGLVLPLDAPRDSGALDAPRDSAALDARVGTDAGAARDAAQLDVVPPYDGGASDGGGRDAGAACIEDDDCGPCERCVGGTCQVDIASRRPCELVGESGTCLNGACCTGCVQGDACVRGDAPMACGRGGGECLACRGGVGQCDSDICDAGECAGAHGVKELTTGTRVSCVRFEGDAGVWCWGDESTGAFGAGLGQRTTPVRAPLTDYRIDQLSAGGYHMCFVGGSEMMGIDGGLWCAGQATSGQLGLGMTGEPFVRTHREVGGTWVQVSAGDYFTCGIKGDRSLWCWGVSAQGQTAVGPGEPFFEPAFAGDSLRLVHVVAASAHACGIDVAGVLWCWGDSARYESPGGESYPVMISTPGVVAWRAVSLGVYSTCAITTDDRLYCWGGNAHGELGLGDHVRRDAPTLVAHPSGRRWAQIAGYGQKHHCALDEDGELYCWGTRECDPGSDWYPCPPPESLSYGDTPTRIPSSMPWQLVSDGWGHSCAVREDDTVWCWGWNGDWQLGIGGAEGARPVHPPYRLLPTRVCFFDDPVAAYEE